MNELSPFHLPMHDLCAWYDLGATKTTITVAIHPDAFQRVIAYLSDQQRMTNIGNELGLRKLTPPDRKKWGFNGIATTSPPTHEHGWPTIVCHLPKCLTSYDEGRLYAISGTLGLIFGSLSQEAITPAEATRQLCCIVLPTERKSKGANICALISPAFATWIKTADQEIFTAARCTMIAVATRLLGRFGARIKTLNIGKTERGQLGMGWSDDACDLGPEGSLCDDEDRGYEIDTHNCDNPAQQLTLLAGLAALCQAARKAGV